MQQKGSDITGYSLLNGKQTNFKGKIQQTDLNHTLTLNEIGQGASVGRFILEYKGNTSPIEAQWLPTTKTVKPKFFSLNAQQCKYAKGQYMRNEIYARHGYAFQNKNWATTFSQYDWYMPCYTNVDTRLTQIEKENVKRLKMVEPYAKEVDWGR